MSLIELRPQKGKYIPILFCERCHKPIRSVYEAMLFNDPEAIELLKQLKELQWRASRKRS
ncbi:hypothetical protein ES703_101054 [subsurface metagenome]